MRVGYQHIGASCFPPCLPPSRYATRCSSSFRCCSPLDRDTRWDHQNRIAFRKRSLLCVPRRLFRIGADGSSLESEFTNAGKIISSSRFLLYTCFSYRDTHNSVYRPYPPVSSCEIFPSLIKFWREYLSSRLHDKRVVGIERMLARAPTQAHYLARWC